MEAANNPLLNDSRSMTTTILLADVTGFFVGLGSTALILLAIASIFWIWALVDCATNPKLGQGEKIVWLLVIFFLHLVGAIIYVAAGRTRRLTA